MYRHLLVERRGLVEHVVLHRPEVRNAFNPALIAELHAWAVAFDPASARAAVLSGAGRAFSAGGDLTWMASSVDFSREENIQDAERMAAMFLALDRLPVPLIGRVHGAAMGGGTGLAAVCDTVVAASDAVFGFTEVKLGLVPAVIAPFVLAKIGRSAARELFLSGARFSAARAQEIGLVHAVVPAEDLDRTVNGYLAEILTSGPEAVRTAKAMIAAAWNLPLEEAAELAAETLATRRTSAEGQEGIRAFLQKRRAAFQATLDDEPRG